MSDISQSLKHAHCITVWYILNKKKNILHRVSIQQLILT